MSVKTRKTNDDRRASRSEAGFTLFEMLVSTGLIVLITGGVFSLLNPSYGTFQAQPEVSDMQQRLRVAADSRAEGPGDGRRRHLFRRHGRHARQLLRADPAARGRHHQPRPGRVVPANPLCPLSCASAVTIMYVPTTNSQTTIRHRHADAVVRAQGESAGGLSGGRSRALRVQRRRSRAHLRPQRRLRHLHDHQRPGRRATPAASRRQVHDEVPGRRVDHAGRVAHLLPERAPARTCTSSGTTTARRPICPSSTTSSISASSSSAIRCRRS